MKIQIGSAARTENTADVTVIWVCEGGELLSSAEQVDDTIQAMIRHLGEEQEFTGEYGQIQYVNLARKDKPNRLLLAGVGKASELTLEKFRTVMAKSIRAIQKQKMTSGHMTFAAPRAALDVAELVKTAAEVALLADYQFEKYLSKNDVCHLERLDILCQEAVLEACEAAAQEGVLLGEATTFARELVNEPANVLVPIKLAEAAQDAGKQHGFAVQVYDEQQIEALGMRAFREVSKAAINPPRLIVMKYTGNPAQQENLLGLVGKGLTYDSGGLSLKTKDGMVNMKDDMSGAAAVIGAMSAIARAQLPVNVVAVVAACENMVSATGYRPGDIIGSMAGKSIKIKSTDAEGRLTLADAVYYIVECEGATQVVDIATLTGAAWRALGDLVTPVMATDDTLYSNLEQASALAGEQIWRIPLVEAYKVFLKTDGADLINSAGAKGPNMILGGLFIGEFIQETPWAHMDIAGTSWTDKAREDCAPGGTGVGVRTLYYLAKLRS